MPKQKRTKRISKTAKRRVIDKTQKINRKRPGPAYKPESAQHSRGDGIVGGIFCEVYGDSIENRVKEEFLTFRNTGAAVSDIVEEVKISKPKAYQVVYKFLEKGYVKKFRKIGGTQLYILNSDHPIVKLWIASFSICMKMAGEESYLKEKAKMAC